MSDEEFVKIIEDLTCRCCQVSFYEGGYDDGDPFVCVIENGFGIAPKGKFTGTSLTAVKEAFEMAISRYQEADEKLWDELL